MTTQDQRIAARAARNVLAEMPAHRDNTEPFYWLGLLRASVETLLDAFDPAVGMSGCVRFVRPGQVAPGRPVPDRCVACGQPEAAHAARCDVDWGSATPSQRCTLPAGHLSKHVDGTGGWAPEPAPAPGIDLGDDPDGDNTPEDDLAALLAESHECYWCGWYGTGMVPCPPGPGYAGKWECANPDPCRRRCADAAPLTDLGDDPDGGDSHDDGSYEGPLITGPAGDAPLTGCVRCGASGVPLVPLAREPGLVCENTGACGRRVQARQADLRPGDLTECDACHTTAVRRELKSFTIPGPGMPGLRWVCADTLACTRRIMESAKAGA